MKKIALVLVAAVLLPGLAASTEEIVPFDIQVPLVLKALTYDRNLKVRASDQVRIAVVNPPKATRDVGDLRASLDKMPGRTVNGLPVVFKEISAADDAAFEAELRDGLWAVVYVMPGFSRADLARVRRICESRHVLPVAAAVDDLDHGLAFGIAVQGTRPLIVVNLPASKACGSDFDLALLQLSKVLQ